MMNYLDYDPLQYIKLKNKSVTINGNTSPIAFISSGIAGAILNIRKFSPEDGSEQMPEKHYLLPKRLEAQKEAYESYIKAIDEMLKDIEEV